MTIRVVCIGRLLSQSEPQKGHHGRGCIGKVIYRISNDGNGPSQKPCNQFSQNRMQLQTMPVAPASLPTDARTAGSSVFSLFFTKNRSRSFVIFCPPEIKRHLQNIKLSRRCHYLLHKCPTTRKIRCLLSLYCMHGEAPVCAVQRVSVYFMRSFSLCQEKLFYCCFSILDYSSLKKPFIFSEKLFFSFSSLGASAEAVSPAGTSP